MLERSMSETPQTVWQQVRTHLDPRWLAFWLILPFLVLGLGWLVEKAGTLNRFDPAYFSESARARHADPRETVAAAVEAMVDGDQAAMAELQGLRRPRPFQVDAELVYVFPYDMFVGHRRTILTEDPNAWDRVAGEDVRFASFLYAEKTQHEMIPYTAEQVEGRWVFVPPDGLYLYFQTGGYVRLWRTVVFYYYLALILVGVWVYIERVNKARRARRWGSERPVSH
jgi:hypothetical protein